MIAEAGRDSGFVFFGAAIVRGKTKTHGLQYVDQIAIWYTKKRGAQTFEIGILIVFEGFSVFEC
jgi:hypothetical protein